MIRTSPIDAIVARPVLDLAFTLAQAGSDPRAILMTAYVSAAITAGAREGKIEDTQVVLKESRELLNTIFERMSPTLENLKQELGL